MNYQDVQQRKQAVLEYAKQSTCRRRKVAAFVFDENFNLMGSGFNDGVIESCNDINCSTFYPCENTTHAEPDAIIDTFTYNSKSETPPQIITVTLFPCKNCAKLIILSGIKRVEYIENYRDMSALKLFEKKGIEVVQI